MSQRRAGSRPPPRSQAQQRPRRPASTRRAREAARRTAQRRRRWIGYSAAGLGLAFVVALIAISVTGRHANTLRPSIGARAPDGSFSTAAGETRTVSSLRGRPALLWFVATWCSSCQAGTQEMASSIDRFAGNHVRVVELEMADDLGQSGPSITDFGRQLAGSSYLNPDWTWGVASSSLTTTYNPSGYLDIYYLLDASGKVVYVNSSPASTMNQLLDAASTLRSSSASSSASPP
jgi:hypothetical protein